MKSKKSLLNEIEELNSNLIKVNETIINQENQLADKKKKIIELEQNLEKEINKKEELLKNFSESESEKEKIKQNLKEIELNRDSLFEEFSKLKEEIEKYQEYILTLKKEKELIETTTLEKNKELMKTIEIYEIQKQNQEKKIGQLREILISKEAENLNLKNTIKILQSKRDNKYQKLFKAIAKDINDFKNSKE